MQKIVRDFFNNISQNTVDVVYSSGKLDANYFEPKLTEEQVGTAQKLVENSLGKCSFADFIESSDSYFEEPWTDRTGNALFDEIENSLEVQQDWDLVNIGGESSYLLSLLGEDEMGRAQEYSRECELMAKMTKDSIEYIIELFEDFLSENKAQYFDE